MNQLKYINHSLLGIIIWPGMTDLFHSKMADACNRVKQGKILSAGFVKIREGQAICYGKSESLQISSLPGDSALVQQMLDQS